MTDTRLLIGSLSNDLFRVATLTQRGSTQAAERFLTEAKRWAHELIDAPVQPYIARIVTDIQHANTDAITLESAETYLMYGILLQNYALHSQ